MVKSIGMDSTGQTKRRRPPGKNIKAREDQLIDLAVTLAERQIKNGSASAQVITHFLKLGSTVAQLEKEKIAKENKLLEAKTESLESQKRIEDLYANALAAMRSYSKVESDEEDN